MRQRRAGTLPHPWSMRVLLVLTGMLGFACAGGKQDSAQEDTAQGDTAQPDAAALYVDDSATRTAAAERLAGRGQQVVPLLDPFESGCIRSDSFPAYCANFDRALELTVTILGRVASASADSANPAKDLLWHMLHAHTGDAFEDLGQRPEWQRTDADALRARGAGILDKLMAISADLTEDEIARRATASTRDAGRRWYVVSNCAGGSMYAGCSYGSYLFDAQGRRVSFRFIPWDEPDNFGVGFALSLKFPSPGNSVGVARALGGLGGDLERLTFYRLAERQAPLCRLETAHAVGSLLRDYSQYVSVNERGCRVLRKHPRIRVERFS